LATHLWNDIISDATSAIKDVYRAIPTFPPTDIDDLTRAAAKASARAKSFKPTILRTANLIVETLRDSIMVVLDRSRTHRARTSENMTASEVTRLLDASVDLIAPASEAVSKAACSTRVAGKDTAQTNSLAVESVQRVFEEQAAQLKKWKTKHREAIALKLADKNPAKMAAIAEALETIVQVLDELSRVGQRRSRETGVDEWLLGSIMKSFETSVQSLVTIEGQMELIETPPSYADIAKDRVILSIDGAIEGSRLTVAS
jgi:flagellar biosynthesis/type III secretory pathway ATPase